MCFLNFYTLVFWTPLIYINITNQKVQRLLFPYLVPLFPDLVKFLEVLKDPNLQDNQGCDDDIDQKIMIQ